MPDIETQTEIAEGDKMDYEDIVATESAIETAEEVAGPSSGVTYRDYREVTFADESDLQESSENTYTANDKVIKKAILFVKTFVRKFEKKSSEYFEEAKPSSKIRKVGKIANYIDSTQKGFIPPIIRGVTDKASEAIASSNAQEHKRTAKGFFAATVPFRKDMRKILVEASLEIFQKFGDQFIKVVDANQTTWERGIEKLAIDAVSRAINYISATNRKEDLPVNLITKGVVLGQSKSETLTKSLLKKTGYKVRDEQSDKIWETSDLLRNIGIRKANGNYVQYYTMKENSCAEKYGYRFPFKWESEEWSNIGEYKQDPLLRKEEYNYTLNERKKEKLASSIFREINGEDLVQRKHIEGMEESIEKHLSKQDKNLCQMSFNFGQLPEFFLRRKKVLEDLIIKLHGKSQEIKMSRMVLISGGHGVGKSELARDCGFSERRNNVFVNIIWIDASSRLNILSSFRKLATRLGISIKKEAIQPIVKNIYQHLKNTKNLFVFDNAENYEQVKEFLPANFSSLFDRERPFVLITSSNKNWKIEGMEEIELGDFEPKEAKEFIEKHLGKSQESQVALLLEKAGYSPLTLNASIPLFKENKLSIKECIKLYEALQQPNSNPSKVQGINEKFFTVIQVHIGKMKKEKNIAYVILVFMAHLNANQIDTKEIFLQENFLPEKSKEDKQKALDLLNKRSLINLREGIAKIHQEVQKILRLEQKENEEEILKKIIKLLKDNECKNQSHIVSVWNYISKYSKLVNEFINSDYTGSNILHLLAIDGNEEVIKLILEKINPSQLSNIINASNKDKYTPLQYAVMHGHLGLVKYLIEKKADLKVEGMYYDTLLHLTAVCSQPEIAKHLIDNEKFDLNEINGDGDTPLNCAIKNSDLGSAKYLEVIKCLVKRGANVNPQMEDVEGPLHLAAKNDSLDIIEYLIQQGADVKRQDEDGNTPLHFAAENGCLNIVEYLAQQGAPVNLKNKNIMSPLHLAAKNDQLDIIKYLIEKNAVIDLRDKDGMSPLYYAVIYNHLESVAYLVQQGADMNLQNNEDMGPLHFAVMYGYSDIAYYLIMQGAKVNLQNEEDITPLHFAAENGNFNIICHLIDQGADITLQDKSSMSPIDYATANGHLYVFQCALEQVANVNQYNNLLATGYLYTIYYPAVQFYDPHTIYYSAVQPSASDSNVQSHKRHQETSVCLSKPKKIKSENISVPSEENASNIQLLQDSQNTANLSFNLKESLFTLKRKLNNCTKVMQEEEINSQLENSYSQQLLNNKVVF